MSQAPQRLQASAIGDHFRDESIPAGALPVPGLYVEAGFESSVEADVKARYPGVQYERIPCAHFINLERPEELNQLLQRFLNTLAVEEPSNNIPGIGVSRP